MGSIVQYACRACDFSTERLSVGWGKAGRAKFWGGLAICPPCQDVTVVNLTESRGDRSDHRCTRCKGPLTLIEGLAQTVKCPRCSRPMQYRPVGSWS